LYRLWRDGGYAIGALMAGIIADLLGVPWAMAGIAALTFASGLIVLARMYETLPSKRPANVENALVDRGRAAAPVSGSATR